MSYGNPNHKFYVANRNQKALFMLEIQGQLSDGSWENASPMDHWIDWCQLKDDQIIITNDPATAGRNFWTKRDRYGLTSNDLLSVVGTRMIVQVKLCQVFDFNVAEMLESYCFGLTGIFHGVDRLVAVHPEYAYLTNAEIIDALEDYEYTMKDLKKDLVQLRDAMKQYRK